MRKFNVTSNYDGELETVTCTEKVLRTLANEHLQNSDLIAEGEYSQSYDFHKVSLEEVIEFLAKFDEKVEEVK